MRASKLANEGADGLAHGGRYEVELTGLGRRSEIAGFDCPLIAGFEVSTEGGGVVWTQEFKIHPCVKVLDVSTSIEGDSSPAEIQKIEVALALVMMGALDRYVNRKKAWKPGYLVPRFVMDAAKLAGFEGILYRSARAFEGQNLVLFRRDWPAECVGEPKRHEEKEPPEPEQMF